MKLRSRRVPLLNWQMGRKLFNPAPRIPKWLQSKRKAWESIWMTWARKGTKGQTYSVILKNRLKVTHRTVVSHKSRARKVRNQKWSRWIEVTLHLWSTPDP